MTSADFLQFNRMSPYGFDGCHYFVLHRLARPPPLRAVTFLSYICCIYNIGFGQYWTLLCLASSSALYCLICSFCSSDQEFATGLLHTPPHDGRTCLSLTVPTAKPVVDFHHQVTAHSGQTNKKNTDRLLPAFSFTIYSLSFSNLDNSWSTKIQ